ncbi:Uncharacterised protein [Klebsiella pneumoniae]|nr:Uncharacterised protein [Klebsiella pneumoniae]
MLVLSNQLPKCIAIEINLANLITGSAQLAIEVIVKLFRLFLPCM